MAWSKQAGGLKGPKGDDGSSMSLTEDPPGSGLFILTGGYLTESPPGSGLYVMGAE